MTVNPAVRAAIVAVAAGIACPDCNSENELTELEPGMFVVTVRHDDGCPYFAALPARQ
jgi:hypothetical protein